MRLGFSLLIVPYGIETYYSQPFAAHIQLLIVPYGIETLLTRFSDLIGHNF